MNCTRPRLVFVPLLNFDQPVIDYLNRLLEKTGDLTPAMDSIGAELEARIAKRFETRSDPLGTPWAEWAPNTKKSNPGFLQDLCKIPPINPAISRIYRASPRGFISPSLIKARGVVGESSGARKDGRVMVLP